MNHNSFRQVTDPDQIRQVLDGYLLCLEQQECSFIPAIHQKRGSIWNGYEMKGGHIIEGARPLSATTTSEDKTYSLTNGDSNYTRSIGQVALSSIERIELLPGYAVSLHDGAKPETLHDR